MIWVLDLDETLYDERDFVFSGFRQTAQAISHECSYSPSELFEFMKQEFLLNGRLKIFQELHISYPDIHFPLEDLIQIYRKSMPEINLYDDAKRLLDRISVNRIYLVTDGEKQVQRNKINALGIDHLFTRIFVTDEHGPGAAKPATKCFEMIRSDSKCAWNEMVYVGDDPNKDFVNLKPLGIRKVRVNRGRFKNIFLEDSYEAEFTVENLDDIQGEIFEA